MVKVQTDKGVINVVADIAKVEEGHLKLYDFERVGKYACPLKTKLVSSYAPGSWSSYSVGDDCEHG